MGQVFPLPGGQLEYACSAKAWDGGHMSAAAAEAELVRGQTGDYLLRRDETGQLELMVHEGGAVLRFGVVGEASGTLLFAGQRFADVDRLLANVMFKGLLGRHGQPLQLGRSVGDQARKRLPYSLDYMGSVPWYAGHIEREKAKDLVLKAKDGDYLLRASEEPGMYTLLVRDGGTVSAFSITEEEDGCFRFGPRQFTRANDLVRKIARSGLKGRDGRKLMLRDFVPLPVDPASIKPLASALISTSQPSAVPATLAAPSKEPSPTAGGVPPISDWYAGPVARLNAATFILTQGDGAYMFHQNPTDPNVFYLSANDSDSSRQYKILHNNGRYAMGSIVLESLEDMHKAARTHGVKGQDRQFSITRPVAQLYLKVNNQPGSAATAPSAAPVTVLQPAVPTSASSYMMPATLASAETPMPYDAPSYVTVSHQNMAAGRTSTLKRLKASISGKPKAAAAAAIPPANEALPEDFRESGEEAEAAEEEEQAEDSIPGSRASLEDRTEESERGGEPDGAPSGSQPSGDSGAAASRSNAAARIRELAQRSTGEGSGPHRHGSFHIIHAKENEQEELVEELEDLDVPVMPLDVEGYKALPQRVIEPRALPEHARGPRLNRFRDVLPNPVTRVRLPVIKEDPTLEYINANFVRGFGGRKARDYVAAQAPTDTGLYNFWRLILHTPCRIVLMVTGLTEGGKVKCARYWPERPDSPPLVYGPAGGQITISTTKVKDHGNYIVSTVQASWLQKNYTVYHYWYKTWPDHGAPQTPDGTLDPKPLIDLLKEIRLKRAEVDKMESPLLVHCSAGIGRTGTVIAIDHAMRAIDVGEKVDILKIISELREDRMAMVQHVIQYKYVYQAAIAYSKQVAEEKDEEGRPRRTEAPVYALARSPDAAQKFESSPDWVLHSRRGTFSVYSLRREKLPAAAEDAEATFAPEDQVANDGVVPATTPTSPSAEEEQAQSILQEPWYRSNFTRNQVEETLADTAPGTFLVRKSSRPDHYALSVQLGGKIANMLITPRLTETGQVLYRLGTNEREFSSLKALVEHYMNTGEHGLTPFSSGAVKTLKGDGSKANGQTAGNNDASA